jgi:predicted transcriptional regulator
MSDEKAGWQYESGGTKVSIYVENEVHRAVQERARALERSFSWVVNRALRKELGLIDEDSGQHT